MKLQKLHIKNYKSLVDLEIVEPNPFTVFAGPNGAGKSNIFEALEFNASPMFLEGQYHRLFGSKEDLLSKANTGSVIEISVTIEDVGTYVAYYDFSSKFSYGKHWKEDTDLLRLEENLVGVFWLKSFSRIFIGNRRELKIIYKDDLALTIDCSNLEKVLSRLLEDEIKREDITEYLELFIPGFERIEINSNNLSGTDTLLIYEIGIDKPFTKDLISDGTYNILCLLTAVFQSDEPQFLCVEEPENGLNPHVIETFVELFRSICEDKGHYIWLNTHSQTLIRGLKEEELILVDKEEGATKIKQFKKGDFYGLRADEAWLSNALGAGLPW